MYAVYPHVKTTTAVSQLSVERVMKQRQYYLFLVRSVIVWLMYPSFALAQVSIAAGDWTNGPATWGTGIGVFPGSSPGNTPTVNVTGIYTNCAPLANSLTSLNVAAPAAPGVTLQGAGTITITGTLTVDAPLTITSDLHLVVGGLAGAAAITIDGGGSLTINGISTYTGSITNNGTVNLLPGFGLNIPNNFFAGNTVNGILDLQTAGFITIAAPPLTINSLLRVQAGSGIATVAGITYNAGSVLEYYGLTNSSTNQELNNPLAAALVVNKSGGVLSMPLTQTLNSGCTIASNSVLDLTGGKTLTINPLAATDVLHISGGSFNTDNLSSLFIQGDGTVASSPQTLQFIGFSAQIQTLDINRNNLTSFVLNSSITVTNFTLDDSLSTQYTTLQIATGTVNGNGNLIVNNQGTLAVTGTLTNAKSIVAKAGGTVNIIGAGSLNGNSVDYENSTAKLRYSGAVAKIPSGAELPTLSTTMKGSVEITNTAGVTLNANIQIDGNLTIFSNCSMGLFGFTKLTGTLTFNVSSSLNGAGLGRLVISTTSASIINAITGAVNSDGFASFLMDRSGQTFSFDQSAGATQPTISDTLILQKGYVMSNPLASKALKITNTALNSIQGASATSFVIGPLTRSMLSFTGAAGSYQFPIGKPSTYLPFTIEAPNTNVSPELTIEAFNTNVNGIVGAGLGSLSTTEHWLIHSQISYVNANIRLGRATGGFTPSSVVAYSPNLATPFVSGGGTADVNGLSVISSDRIAASNVIYAIGNVNATPTITSFTPVTGGTATSATIEGANLLTTTQVIFNNRPARSFQIVNNSKIIAIVDSLTTTGNITVVTNGGSSTSAQIFTYVTTPTISSFSPQVGGDDTKVVIRGTNFAHVNSVSFGGVLAKKFTVDSLTQITAFVSGQGASGSVSVGTAGGAVSSAAQFTHSQPPVITSFTPDVGARGTFMIITGDYFSSVMDVLVGGISVLNFTVNSSSKISVVIGSGTTGKITVVTAGGRATSATIFTHGGPPIITSFTPRSGTPGTGVAITGINLLNIEKVLFGSTTASFVADNATQTITAVVPYNSTGGFISVFAVGGSTSSTQKFTIVPSLSISNFTPQSGTGGTLITITGTNFSTISSVRIAGAEALSFSVLSPTTISAIAGNVVTTGTISVTGLGGTTTSTLQFTVIPILPVISELTPIAVTAGNVLTVRGSFLTGVSSVVLGGVKINTYRNVSSTEISITIPKNATSGTLTITNPAGSVTSQQTVRVLLGPTITNFSPPHGSVGSTITFTGLNFTGITSVSFGEVTTGTFTIVSDSVLTAQVPQNAISGVLSMSGPRGATTTREVFFVATPLQLDSITLVAIYNATNGKAWLNNERWLEQDQPIELWYGVGVDKSLRRVTRLILPNNRLTAKQLPDTIRALDELRTLILDSNGIEAGIPAWLGSLRNLDTLRLNGNTFTGTIPDSIFTLPALRVLDFGVNKLSGLLPVGLCNLAKITEISLNDNAYEGELLRCPGTLGTLTTLNLSNNLLTGDLPAELGSLPLLKILRLSGNRFTGAIPTELGAPTVASKTKNNASVLATKPLQVLDLNNNQLSGELPVSMANLTALEILSLQGNKFTNGNTASLADVLGKLSNLRVLNLANNEFQDSLPSALGALTKLEVLDLRSNFFSGIIPKTLAYNSSQLRRLLLDSNKIEGALPATFEFFPPGLEILSLRNNRLTGLLEPPNYQFQHGNTLTELYVGGNALSFAHIENNLDAISSFTYAPQDSAGRDIDSTIVIGTIFSFPAFNSPGNNNRYQWFRNGVAITPQREIAAFNFNNRPFEDADTGTYICKITNTVARDLVIYTRPIILRSILPAPPTEIPMLTTPPHKANNVAFLPRFIWSAITGATRYQVQIFSAGSDFDKPLRVLNSASASVLMDTALPAKSEFFWRVRAENAGGTGLWSLPNSFTTATSGTIIALSSINFGRVVVGDKKSSTATLALAVNKKVTIVDVNIQDDELNFRTDVGVKGIELDPAKNLISFDVTVDFGPKQAGTKNAEAKIVYRMEGASKNDTVTYYNHSTGFGGYLQIIPAAFDTVRVGRAALTTMLIVNKGSKDIQIRDVKLTPESPLAFRIENSPFGKTIVLGGGDTTAVLLRCQPFTTGQLLGTVTVIADVDSTQGSVSAIARLPRVTDVVMTPKLRAVRDNIVPGNDVQLEIFIDEGLESLVTVKESLSFTAIIRYDNNVLRNSNTTLVAINKAAGNTLERVATPTTTWDKSAVLFTFDCRAVLGSIDTTALIVEKFAWTQPNITTPSGITRIFVEVPVLPPDGIYIHGTFTAGICRLDGKRLITKAGTTFTIAQVRPNPVVDEGTIVLYVREQSAVHLTIVDISGKTVQTLLRSNLTPGEHFLPFTTHGLPTGTYFVVLQSPTAVLNRRLQIEK